MSTFVFEYVSALDSQWSEVEILLDQAKLVKENNDSLYHALCRSASILMVAHLEGFTKDLSKNIIYDLNSNCNFYQLPMSIKRTACKKYLGFDKSAIPDYDNKIKDMIEDLSKFDGFDICHTAFLFEKNKNPKPDILMEICGRFGASDIFKNLNESIFESAFTSNKRLDRILKRTKKIISMSVNNFPYHCKVSKFKKFKLESKKYNGRTIWQTFLDDLNYNRHNIAHGNTFGNTAEHHELVEKMNKIRLIQYIIVYISCSEAVKGI
ncbi:HEPN domain-containing protein [Veronia pacifica]|uniref:RiboL-PSP-HEPN domain-containing protein n=1 Tax=Veronia pacifica TaxID=1080227 RepID=A0A1C3EE59_9GAMM|nr:HEPN domain-containing protein [Veronia pacifica]ODA31500.1 hypothetical protein A8L45_16510 [Veronia pacifica]